MSIVAPGAISVPRDRCAYDCAKEAKYEKLLSRVSLLQSISPIERALIADSLKAYHARQTKLSCNLVKGETISTLSSKAPWS